MENEICFPGFTLLRCLSCDRNNNRVYEALDRKSDHMYLSSKAIRETFMSSSTAEVHGPCQSDTVVGKQHDFAFALRCPVWPRQATSFVIRSLNSDWPSYDVLKDICSDGCLFVPINSKNQTCSDVMDLEWRISFSLAEKKLVYSMNHCQFLCYGLFKLFLNEVLKTCSTINDLLCSYFIKTAVFWEISDGARNWVLETFLFKFWNVFSRLIKWVSNGYCPNFFIPENNMFHGKICGEKQRVLLSVLRELYTDGYWCLLRCPSLNIDLTKLIAEPFLSRTLSYNEWDYVSLSNIEMESLIVVLMCDQYVPTDNPRTIKIILHNTLNMNTDTDVMMSIVRLRINFILQRYPESILLSEKSPYLQGSINRKQYLAKRAAKTVLHKVKTYLFMNYLNYAKYAYITGHYIKTIEILNSIKHRLKSRPYMYRWSLDADIVIATRQQGMSYDTLTKSFILSNVVMNSQTSINELQLECDAQGDQIKNSHVNIPPFVFINFLLILCYTRIGDYHRRCEILEELHTLLHRDNGYHIHNFDKPISWEILGICQQICGDHQAAFQSYVNAINEEFNYFQEATITRICSLYFSLYLGSLY